MSQEKEQNVNEEIKDQVEVTEVEAEVAAEAEVVEEAPVVELTEVEKLELQLKEEEERYLRLRADFDNLKRRTQVEREAASKYRSQSLLTDILPVIDNIERALQVKATTEDGESIKKGIEMVHGSLIEAAKKEGLEVIDSVDAPFDPNFHQAVFQEKDDSKEPGIILEELQRGYKLKDRVLRASMVKVNE